MNPVYIGFGVIPYAIIIWRKDDQAEHRTFCDDEQAIQDMLERHQTDGDFYSRFDAATVYYPEQRKEMIA
ncbi:hypothetical protein FH508_0003985 [Lysinibacillus sp. CD3-6]|uniref:hypothetical protein n=1 Tax=Lysinibacillus sp. CD3-6 TaxID=2892541 RepID=UPI001175A5AF|nr:hypothetical protein [Lysinibacillus sp. CD3-6]UED81059.1 hypothetical protein FH508_0003985 [Lysinibacillus sp. CD3-6]